MKKLLLISFLSVVINGFSQDEIKTDCIVEDGKPYLLNYTQTQLIAVNYDLLHHGSREKHTKAYYINSKTILFLDRFFKDNTAYFGFNLYILTYRRQVSSHQSHIRQSFLYLVPVHNIRDTIADYTALKDYFRTLPAGSFSADSLNKGIPCYGMCDSSIMAWTYSTSDERLNERPGKSTDNDIFLLTDNRRIHDDHRNNYREDHDELDKQQTQWVFFKKETIERLAKFITESDINIFPLVGIYFGSYNRKAQGEKQADKNQTVLGFIPMRLMKNKNYEPDICSYIEYQNREKAKSKAPFTENHGTLCPTQCPSGGSKLK